MHLHYRHAERFTTKEESDHHVDQGSRDTTIATLKTAEGEEMYSYVDMNSMPEPTNNNVKLQAPPPPPQHSLGATMKEKGNEEESYYDNE